MSRPSICIASALPLSRNPRVVREARSLAAAGFDVTVATLENKPRPEAFDQELLEGARFHLATSRLPQSLRGESLSIAERAATWVARKLTRVGVQSAYALGPVSRLQRFLEGSPARLTIAHLEIASYVAIRLLSQGRRVAADFEDWYSKDLLPAARRYRPLPLLRRIERTLMRSAAYVSTTSNAMAEALTAEYGGNVPVVLTNSVPLRTFHQRSREASSVPSMIWFSQTIGAGRGLEEFIGAWSRSKEASTLTLLGDCDASYRDHLLALVPEARRPMMRFLARVSEGQLAQIVSSHDIGLALEPGSPPNKNLTISNKVLLYLSAGLAVVASPTAGQREVLSNAAGAGLLFRSEDSEAVCALDGLLQDREQLRLMQSAARRAAEHRYCWENEEPKLLDAVHRALKSGT